MSVGGIHDELEELDMQMNRFDNEEGIIKYGIAWMLGVPISVLVIIFILMRGC
ncbi:hypothetical protein BH23ACI1_BH23ACI1_29960 [soil metagenome]